MNYRHKIKIDYSEGNLHPKVFIDEIELKALLSFRVQQGVNEIPKVVLVLQADTEIIQPENKAI